MSSVSAPVIQTRYNQAMPDKPKSRARVRPPKPKAVLLSVRCTHAERAEIKRAAFSDGLKMSEWIRRAVLGRLGGESG